MDPELAQEIGEVKGKLDAMTDRVSDLEHGQRESARRSTEEHAQVRRDFKTAVDDIRGELVDRLNRHGEEIDDLQESRAGWDGMLRVFGWGGSIVGVGGVLVAILASFGVIG